MRYTVIAGAVLASALSACGPQSPEEERAASVAKCERQFGRMAPDPSKGNVLCTCMIDRLAEEGMEITDVFGGDRAKVEDITRRCAVKAGVALPG